ncbi:MAG: hypothetical protein IJK51_10145 [Bacteroidaceae bacterium]|nr:hypothetical protein [Bacteroidaceae bacterium]
MSNTSASRWQRHATVDGNVFGGGNGQVEPANISGNTSVKIHGGTIGNVFGGSNTQGTIGGTISVLVNKTGTCAMHIDEVYGGGNKAPSKAGQVTIGCTGNEGEGIGDVYGGGLGQKKDYFGATEDIEAYVYGDVTVKLNGSTETGASNNCKVTGNIFGCNNLNGSPKGHVLVHIYRTEGYDDSHKKSAGKDNTTYDVAAVYGGGNMAAYVPNNPESTTEATEVIIEGCDETSIQYVYGGGNAASTPSTNVTVNSCYEIGSVFGGGNGKDALPNGDPNPGANVGYYAYEYNGQTGEVISGTKVPYGTGQADVSLLGGVIHSAFAGSNTKGNVRVAAVAFIDEANDQCLLHIDDIYGGGNEAYVEGNAKIKLGCITSLAVIYGGSKRADVGGDIELNITSGHFDRVFGGNNESGLIHGSITVNIEETGCHPITIGELYGCGNQAPYTTPAGKADPTINVKSFTSIGRIFGGGLGAGAIVKGNPTVNISETLGDNALQTSIYAGTPRTLSDGSSVTLPAHASGAIGAIGSVFGGGNAAKVDGNTTVNIGTLTSVDYVTMSEGETSPRTGLEVKGVDIKGNVFGGGNQADVTGSAKVVVGKE